MESLAASTDPAELALAEEYVALKRRLADARERADHLRRLADHVEEQTRRDEDLLKELEGALGMRAQLQIEQLDRELSGRRLQEVAIRVLSREIEPGQAVHYRDWYSLIRAAGYHIRGKNPLNTFLVQINRTAAVEAIGQRSGRYRLRSV